MVDAAGHFQLPGRRGEPLGQRGLAAELQVDGGVKLDNIRDVVVAGADVLVAGSAVFNTDDYAATITALRERALSTAV